MHQSDKKHDKWAAVMYGEWRANPISRSLSTSRLRRQHHELAIDSQVSIPYQPVDYLPRLLTSQHFGLGRFEAFDLDQWLALQSLAN